MEGVILLGLLGTGYLLNNKDNDNINSNSPITLPIYNGSRTSVYDVNNYRDSKMIEQALVEQKYREAMKGDSKVIDALNMNGRNTLRDIEPSGTNDINSSMSGTAILKDDFLVNDQGIKIEPFFSGSPPNINYDENIQLERHQGGNQTMRGPKKELGQFFGLESSYGNVFGNTFSGADADQSRYVPGQMRTSELPFEQEKVPHIEQGSEITRDVDLVYAQRNNIDNTRTLNNQKVSYGGKIIGGKGKDKRGEIGEVFKNSVNQDYVNSADKWLVTQGAITAQQIYPEYIIKDTNRQHLNQPLTGHVAPTAIHQSEKRPMYKKSTNQQLDIDTTRNVHAENYSPSDDFNKDSYFVYPNEREVTEERTYEGNINSVFKGDTERLQDSVKPTIKQTTLDDSRNGFVSTVSTVPTERLQDNVRPTIKDTTHFDYSGNAGSYLTGSMATDQFSRADLNPNKEIISQGREPTPENTKLSNGMDWMNVDIKKIENDYFNHRINNPDKLYEEIPTDNTCKYTQEKDTLNNVKLSDRLDPIMLDSFRENPYTQSLASFAY